MPPRSRKPESGDVEIPGLQRRPGLIHLLTPETAGIVPEGYADITDDMLRAANPSNLRASLIDVNPEGDSVIWYKPATTRTSTYLAVNPEDYNRVARNVHFIAQTAFSKTLEHYGEEQRFEDEVQAAARRSRVHAIESKVPHLEARLNDIREKLQYTDRFQEMAKIENRNLNRGPTSGPRFAVLMRDVVGEMVSAVGIYRGYNDTGMDLMRRSIEKRLYLAPAFSYRANYFQSLVDLAGDYYGNLGALYATRLADSQRYLRQNTPKTLE